MKINLIQVPYHLGRENVGMGKAPARYLEAGVEQNLVERGFEVKTTTVKLTEPFKDELSAITNINKNLAQTVKQAITDEYFPLVLGGNCNIILGAIAGLSSSDVGIIWFDAHADFNTPETTQTGYLDGMPLAISTGQFGREILEEIGTNTPIPEANTIIIGANDIDKLEDERLKKSEIQIVYSDEIHKNGVAKSLSAKLKNLRTKVQDIYLHLDIDVINKKEAPGVNFDNPEGLSVDEVVQAIKLIRDYFQVKAAALPCYNPDNDEDDKTLKTGLYLIDIVANEVVKNTNERLI